MFSQVSVSHVLVDKSQVFSFITISNEANQIFVVNSEKKFHLDEWKNNTSKFDMLLLRNNSFSTNFSYNFTKTYLCFEFFISLRR